MATKQFKIGERAVGGIIKVDITGKLIQIQALDYYSKKVVSSGSVTTDDSNVVRKIDNYLFTLTSSYHCDLILTWIKSKAGIKTNSFI